MSYLSTKRKNTSSYFNEIPENEAKYIFITVFIQVLTLYILLLELLLT